MKERKYLERMTESAVFEQTFITTRRGRYETLLEEESRYNLAAEILQTDLYIGDKIKFLEMIFGIEKDEDEKGDKS